MASPPFSISETVPADSDFVRLFPAAERAFRDIVESWLTIHSDAASGHGKMPVGDTATLAALSPAQPVGGYRYDTDVNSLQVKVDASTWVNVGPPAGTVSIFFQETAPLGWTKLADLGGDFDGAIIELVTGSTGGDFVAGTAVGTVLASRTIAQANLPSYNLTGTTGGQSASHHHKMFEDQDLSGGAVGDITGQPNVFVVRELTGEGDNNYNMAYDTGGTTAATVGRTADASADHTHSISLASGGSGTAMDFAVKRVKAILCSKD